MAEWAGDKRAQTRAVERILEALRGMHPVDVMGALGTVSANTIADWSGDEADALKGLEAHTGDCRSVIAQRFAPAQAERH
ncbi:hypothetical protein [Aureimonas sp. AU40]|uniref:hypothetical protein n=1 Tax=Aureimonas sp. AU40 TaxID=1637747 RepID=UPI0007809E2D|nr:hypothetical protein [Aureimonas sp. AU40]